MDTPRLHPDTIEAVRDRTDIVDVVSQHVVLKKQGKDFVGLCPFHEDKSPSFSVSPGKQFYYCFSCGAGGNAFKFLMELNKRSFADVVLDLAQRYQVPVTTLEPAKRQELQRQLTLREQLYEILALTARFYEHALQQIDGATALAYLYERGLNDATIQQFQLGFAPGGWQTLYGYLVEQKHYPVELVEKAGLIVPRQKGDGHYDRFRDRLMIPIRDGQSRVIGFGGRALGDEKPKYLNSPDTELFDKGKTLYGLDLARAAIAKDDRAIVVEGYFDVIALYSAGLENSVAALGTALNAAQVRQLLRYTESKQILLNFDADAAGVKAAQRAIGEVEEMAYRGDVQLRVLNIPDGKDPDEFLRHHSAAAYRDLIEAAPLWIDWQINNLIGGKDLRQADQFQQTSQAVVKLLSDIANADTRTHYVRYCAEIFSNGDSRLVPLLAENLVTQVRRQRRTTSSEAPTRSAPATTPSATSLEQAEAALLRIFLHDAAHRDEIRQVLEDRDLQFSYSHHRALWRQMQQLLTKADDPRVDLVNLLRNQLADTGLATTPLQALLHLSEKAKRDIIRAPLIIRAAAACMEKNLCEKRYRHFLALWEKTDCTIAPEQFAEYQRQIYAEKRRIEVLEKDRQVSFEDLAIMPWVGEQYDSLDR
ncbi:MULTISPECIES: DNA primase [Cyanophyceae]|uniref:DNA primase n=1 Tax=Cyanophyceae TaxID=3028117 RepID=UPI00168923C8|nr:MULTISPECIES: DNA primase [Cyanophyceae]MBD1916605.1 DNA primase [Phormidium sp. FACHB-77]MBD2032172.1 DNA primase [Phormidium sp. FACHB-322]MBD2053052.1 DNA primase [Leptolyngbya sp. FACHB-60]